MSFTPNIPAVGQSLGLSRPQVLNNFAVIRSSFDQDHVDFNTAGAGKHKFVTLINNTAPGTGAGEGVLFSWNSGSNLAYQLPSGGAGAKFITFISGGAVLGPPGYTTLAGDSASGKPIYLQWGNQGIASQGTTTTISFPIMFPTACLNVQVTYATSETSPSANNAMILIGSLNQSQFKVVNSSSSSSRECFWTAIGY